MSKIKLKCNFCEEDVFKFPSEIRGENVYCNKDCYNAFKEQNRETRQCDFCQRNITRAKSKFISEMNFCDVRCKNEWQREGLKGNANPFYGKTHSDETLDKMSKTLVLIRPKGENHPRYNSVEVECDICGEPCHKTAYLVARSKNLYCSNECRHIGQSDIMAGTSNPNHNPYLTKKDRERNRPSILGYTKFKSDVLRRDNNQCVVCCAKDDLVVHHLNSHHWDKENRVNPDNGITLCDQCHKEFHNRYGYKFNTKEQFNNFIKAPL